MLLLVKILLNRPKGLSRNGGFQQLISQRKKLTLTRDPHQCKIWTFYLLSIPSLGENGLFWTKNRHFWTTSWEYSTKPSKVVAFFKQISTVCTNFIFSVFSQKNWKFHFLPSDLSPFRRSYLWHRSSWTFRLRYRNLCVKNFFCVFLFENFFFGIRLCIFIKI
jgi:hypothetical protein